MVNGRLGSNPYYKSFDDRQSCRYTLEELVDIDTHSNWRSMMMAWITGGLVGFLVLAGTTASAAPPVLSNPVISPTVFDLDDRLPIVTIAVDVRDPDDDLNLEKVKAIVIISAKPAAR